MDHNATRAFCLRRQVSFRLDPFNERWIAHIAMAVGAEREICKSAFLVNGAYESVKRWSRTSCII